MRLLDRLDATAVLVALCAFCALDSALSPAQESVLVTFHLSLVQYGWICSAQFLAIAVATPVVGRCGDVFDKRVVLGCAMALACVGAAISMRANSAGSYLIGQVLMGSWVGASTVAQALVGELLPPERQASGQGVVQGTTGFFATLGMVGTGPLLNVLGTRYLFFITVLLALPCSIFLMRRMLTQARAGAIKANRIDAALDVRGAIVLACILALFCGGLQYLTEGGWLTAMAVAFLVSLAGLIPYWIRAQKRHPSPLVDVRLLGQWNVACLHVVALSMGIATTAMFILLPMLVVAASAAGAKYGSTATVVGLLLLPIGLIGTILVPFYGFLDRHFQAGSVLAFSLLLMGISLAIPTIFRQEIWPIVASTTLFGAGLSLLFTEGITELLRLVPEERAAGASSTFTLAKTIGGSIGATLFTVVIGSEAESASTASLPKLDLAFRLAAAICVLGTVAALAIQRRKGAMRADFAQ